jgi:KEOPS complex subunit Pcc1
VAPNRHDADISFQFDTERRARIVAESVRQEVDEIDGDRTRASVERAGRTVTVAVAARDLVALRAGVNTWTTLVSVAERLA